jgi:hypothetical protein
MWLRYLLGSLVLTVAWTVPTQAQLMVDIDVKPGSDVNPINLKAQGKTPIAVLCTPLVTPSALGGLTLMVGTAIGEQCRFVDVDSDGCQDIVCQFATQDLGVTCETTELTVIGTLADGTTFTGTDTITPKPCNKPKE